MILEVCADSYETCQLAEKYGAKRVELCSGLSVGGLTPSPALIQKCSSLDIEIHVMIRHREGGFVYSDEEIEIMISDILMAKENGAKGVVFGCLNDRNEIHQEHTQKLCRKARDLGLEITFHRAFDFVKYPIKSLEILISMGAQRILTSGGKAKAIEGIYEIKDLVDMADGRIQIMAGSGVNADNAEELAEIGVHALHFTSHKARQEAELGMGVETVPDEEKIRGINEKLKVKNEK